MSLLEAVNIATWAFLYASASLGVIVAAALCRGAIGVAAARRQLILIAAERLWALTGRRFTRVDVGVQSLAQAFKGLTDPLGALRQPDASLGREIQKEASEALAPDDLRVLYEAYSACVYGADPVVTFAPDFERDSSSVQRQAREGDALAAASEDFASAYVATWRASLEKATSVRELYSRLRSAKRAIVLPAFRRFGSPQFRWSWLQLIKRLADYVGRGSALGLLLSLPFSSDTASFLVLVGIAAAVGGCLGSLAFAWGLARAVKDVEPSDGTPGLRTVRKHPVLLLLCIPAGVALAVLFFTWFQVDGVPAIVGA